MVRVIGRLALCALLLSGLGMAAAEDESMSLGEVRRLAEQGHALAQYNLGVLPPSVPTPFTASTMAKSGVFLHVGN